MITKKEYEAALRRRYVLLGLHQTNKVKRQHAEVSKVIFKYRIQKRYGGD